MNLIFKIEFRARNQLYENICEFKFGMNGTPKHPATNQQLIDVKLLHGNLASVHDQNKEPIENTKSIPAKSHVHDSEIVPEIPHDKTSTVIPDTCPDTISPKVPDAHLDVSPPKISSTENPSVVQDSKPTTSKVKPPTKQIKILPSELLIWP